jgi:hypothetical protein
MMKKNSTLITRIDIEETGRPMMRAKNFSESPFYGGNIEKNAILLKSIYHTTIKPIIITVDVIPKR